MKKRIYQTAVAVLLIAGVAWYLFVPPTSWSHVKNGMTLEEVCATIGRPSIMSPEKYVVTWRRGIWVLRVMLTDNADSSTGQVTSIQRHTM
jgi:hypothetical protein